MSVWQLGRSRLPQFKDALRRSRESAQNVRDPAIDWPDRAPNDIIVTGQ